MESPDSRWKLKYGGACANAGDRRQVIPNRTRLPRRIIFQQPGCAGQCIFKLGHMDNGYRFGKSWKSRIIVTQRLSYPANGSRGSATDGHKGETILSKGWGGV